MKIKGLSRNAHGVFWFRPSSAGLPAGSPRPKSIALGTRDADEAIAAVLHLRNQGHLAPNGQRSTGQ